MRAVDIGVFGLARPDRLDRGFLDEIRGVEIGFARTQADNVAALPFQLKRLGGKRERGGRRDAVKRGGGLRHGHYLRMYDLQAGRPSPGGDALRSEGRREGK